MSSLPLELEARVLWKTGRLFKFLKWQSAHEVDFGAFLVEFDFKQGQVRLRYPNGEVQQVASFAPQKRGTSITGIVGPISVGEDYLVELQPATAESAASIQCSGAKDEALVGLLQMDASAGRWNVVDKVNLLSVVEGRDTFLKVSYSEECLGLAVILASLTVFLRFSH